jgi:5,10-methylenetetrahydromethanopterin reductase
MTTQLPPVGLLIGSHIAPHQIGPTARLAEEQGFGEVWITEDLWFTSGIVGAGAALAATDRIPVGLGIVSAVTRHVSIQALDFATLGHAYPGRFWPGIGVGLPAWLEQMGILPGSPMRAVREAVEGVRALLGGETLSYHGVHAADAIALAYPLDPVPPIYIGAVGPKSMTQAGLIADGVVASVLAGTEYVAWSRKLVDEAAAGGERSPRPRIVTFALYCGGDDAEAARAAIRPTVAFYLTLMLGTDLMKVYGIDDELAALAEGGPDAVAAKMPDSWVEDLAIAGDADECAGKVQALLDAGSDSVILFPAPFERGDELVRFAGTQVIPRVVS